MKLNILIPALGLALFMPFANAGDYKSKEKLSEQAIEALNLSENKSERVQEIMDDYYEGKEEIKQRMQEEIAKLKETKEKNLQAVLSEDEMEQLEELQEGNRTAYEETREMPSVN